MEKDRIWDSIFNKGNIILHKYGEEELAIYNVYNPYESVEVMESILWEKEDHHEDEGDKFDMIMDTLSGVVKDFLERKWLPESSHTHRHHGEEDEQWAEYEAHEHSFHEHEEKSEKKDEYTLDLR